MRIDAPEPWGLTGETAELLTPGHDGRWLITTITSRHIWDLDRMTYQRLPGSTGTPMSNDDQEVAITRVAQWPAVGNQSLLFYDSPEAPSLFEEFRLSAIINRIQRIAPSDSIQSDVR